MSGGVAWAAAARWFDVAASMLSFLVLAWILGPEAWGLFGMALVVTVLPETILGGALSDSLIQRSELRSGHVGAARTLQLGLASIFFAGCLLLSPVFAQWFGRSEVALLVPALALTFIPLGFAAPSIALLQRHLRFREIALVDAAGAAAAAAVGISSALAGGGVWSLVAMEAARRSTRAVMFLVVEGSAPSLRFDWVDMRDLTHFNLMTLYTQLLMQIDLAVPRLVVGATMGPHSLGYFNFAWRLYQQGSSLVIAPFNAVVLPTIARLRDDRQHLHEAIRRIMRASTIAAYPVFLGGAAIAPVAVPVALGEHWRPAVTVIQLILLLGLRSATNAFSGSILRGCGKPGLQTANVAVGVVATCCLVPLAAQYGVEAVACAMLIKAALVWVSGAILVERVSGYSALNQVAIGWRNLLSASLMAVSVLIATPALAEFMGGWPLLMTLIAGGMLIYSALVAVLNPKAARDAALPLVRRLGRLRSLGGRQAR
jgi:O-antigen/teichoic acid export membrane protein